MNEDILKDKELLAVLDQTVELDFKAQLMQFEEENPTPERKPFPIIPVMAIAASFVILLMGTLIFRAEKARSSEELFAAYFDPYPNVVHPLTRSGEGQPDVYDRGFSAYETSNYEDAADLFAEVEGFKYPIYLAISYLGSEPPRAEKALKLLKKLDLQTDITHWYSALAYLELNELDAAIEEL
ncbi:MAG: hypothetical protein AAF740_04635, partial [Bacteroidota bacterium]